MSHIKVWDIPFSRVVNSLYWSTNYLNCIVSYINSKDAPKKLQNVNTSVEKFIANTKHLKRK